MQFAHGNNDLALVADLRILRAKKMQIRRQLRKDASTMEQEYVVSFRFKLQQFGRLGTFLQPLDCVHHLVTFN